MTLYAKSLTQAIQRLNANPYNLTKDECIQVVRELRTELEALPAEPKDQTEWDRVYALIRHWSQRAQAVEAPLEAFREAQVEAGLPEEDLMPMEPAAAVAWLIKAMPEWR